MRKRLAALIAAFAALALVAANEPYNRPERHRHR